MSHILAIGGGGFQMEDDSSPIDDFILELTGKPQPRICLLPTPSGDTPDLIERFYAAYTKRHCTPSHLAFFQREPRPGAVPLSNLAPHLLSQDAIFVSGGNARAALAVWREWRLDEALRQALSNGTLLAGMSAGAMCWFEKALTDTYWEDGFHPVPGLGWLPGGCRVHYDNSPDQRPRLHAALMADAVPTTIAIDDEAAVLFRGTEVVRVVAWRAGATAHRVSLVDGRVQETAYQSDTLEPTS